MLRLVMFGREKLVYVNKMKDEMKFHVVPITEDDDMLSPYGISKARRCLRTKLDSVFFAGACTGGSPWNRIIRWVSEATTQLIEAKKQYSGRCGKCSHQC